jgi:hypothetical protein
MSLELVGEIHFVIIKESVFAIKKLHGLAEI